MELQRDPLTREPRFNLHPFVLRLTCAWSEAGSWPEQRLPSLKGPNAFLKAATFVCPKGHLCRQTRGAREEAVWFLVVDVTQPS